MTTAEQDYKDLSKALSLANWGTLGLLVPFFGWFFGGYALNIVKAIEKTDNNARKISAVKRTAWTVIILSSISAGGWWYVYNARTEDANRQAAIQACIEKANKDAEYMYGIAVAADAPGESYSSIEQTKQAKINNCYKAD